MHALFQFLLVVHSCSDFSRTLTIHISSAISYLKSFLHICPHHHVVVLNLRCRRSCHNANENLRNYAILSRNYHTSVSPAQVSSQFSCFFSFHFSFFFDVPHHKILNKFSPSCSPRQRGTCHNAATSLSKAALGTCSVRTSAWLTSPAILCTFGMFCSDICWSHIVCTSMLCVFQVQIVVRLLAHSSCLQKFRLCGSLVGPSIKIVASVELNDIVGRFTFLCVLVSILQSSVLSLKLNISLVFTPPSHCQP